MGRLQIRSLPGKRLDYDVQSKKLCGRLVFKIIDTSISQERPSSSACSTPTPEPLPHNHPVCLAPIPENREIRVDGIYSILTCDCKQDPSRAQYRNHAMITESLFVGDADSRVEPGSAQKALFSNGRGILYLTICTLFCYTCQRHG